LNIEDKVVFAKINSIAHRLEITPEEVLTAAEEGD
jgi:hypothetical protein